MAKKVVYSEPVDFIPKSVRRELKLGEFNTDAAKKPAKKAKSSKKK